MTVSGAALFITREPMATYGRFRESEESITAQREELLGSFINKGQ